MQKNVASLLDNKRKEIADASRQKKIEHLISLGLLDYEKAEKKYISDSSLPSFADPKAYGFVNEDEKGKFKYEWPEDKPVTIEVSDEEYTEICKLFPPSNDNKANETHAIRSYAEEAVTIIAFILLIVGIIAAFFCIVVAVLHSTVQWALLASGISVLLCSVITWASLLVMVNISHKIDILIK